MFVGRQAALNGRCAMIAGRRAVPKGQCGMFVDTKQRTHLPIGYELKDWWCIAENASVKIEITSVELTKSPAKETP